MTRMQVIWFLVAHALLGFAIAAVFVGLLLAFDVASLRSLVMGSDVGLMAVLLLIVFLGQSFAGLQIAFAVWLTASDEDDDDEGGGSGLPEPVDQLLLAPVRSWQRSRRR